MKAIKENDFYAHLEHDGKKVGHVENYHDGYFLEVGYERLWLTKDKRRLVIPLALKIHLRQIARLKRTMIKEHKLRNSIYNR